MLDQQCRMLYPNQISVDGNNFQKNETHLKKTFNSYSHPCCQCENIKNKKKSAQSNSWH